MQRDYCPLFRSINTSEKLAALPDDACRLFYLLLLPQCDSWGRIGSGATGLCAKVWPALGRSPSETARVVEVLLAAGLIELRRSEDQAWIQVPDWEEKAGSVGHSYRRGKSTFPDPTPDNKSGVPVRTTSPDTKSTQSRAEQRREEQSRGEQKAPVGCREGLEDWEVILPEFSSLDLPEVREAAGRWTAFRRKTKRVRWKDETWREKLSEAVKWGPTGFVAAVAHSIGNNYQGLFLPNDVRPAKADQSRAAMDSFVSKMNGASQEKTINVEAQEVRRGS